MAHPGFVEHCLELLEPLGAVRARRMFGGHGLYLGDLFIALVVGDRLYLKADADTEARFVQAGCAPFEYRSAGRTVRLGYRSAPTEALESAADMRPWALLARQAALAALSRRPPARPRRASAPTSGAKTREPPTH